jgi:pilus assembly protein CpaB
MPNRLKITVVAAIFFGFIAAYGIYNFLQEQKARSRAMQLETQDIVVAGKDIPAGTTFSDKSIQQGLIKSAKWPKTSVPRDSFISTQELMGKVVKVKIVAGEPLLKSRMAGEEAGLTVRLTPGHRAMAVRVDEVIGVSGFIKPDDRVDVIVTAVPPGRTSQAEKLSKIVLQNKRVLSVAQNLEQRDGKPQVVRSITLEVTPEEAEKLSLASQEGQIILALRAMGDEQVATTRGSNKSDLLSVSAPRRRAGSRRVAASPETYRVEVYHGNEKSVVEF